MIFQIATSEWDIDLNKCWILFSELIFYPFGMPSQFIQLWPQHILLNIWEPMSKSSNISNSPFLINKLKSQTKPYTLHTYPYLLHTIPFSGHLILQFNISVWRCIHLPIFCFSITPIRYRIGHRLIFERFDISKWDQLEYLPMLTTNLPNC